MVSAADSDWLRLAPNGLGLPLNGPCWPRLVPAIQGRPGPSSKKSQKLVVKTNF